MRKRLVLALIAVALFWIYRTAFLYAVGYATSIHFPTWWFDLVPRRDHGILAWVFLCHTVAVILVSLPVAWVLALVYGRIGVWLGAAGALALLLPGVVSTLRFSPLMSPLAAAVTGFDFLKVAVALPLAVWLLLRLPSNYRWSGP